MRIFYDHQVFSLQDAGGVTRYQYELVRNLQRSTDVKIAMLMGLNASVMSWQELSSAQTRILGWRTGLRPGYVRYAINESISAVLPPTLGQFDIYHVMLYRAIPFLRRRRLVVTHHDCTHERFPHLFRNASFIIEKKRMLFSRADAIICVSESSRRDLLHFHNVDENKTYVIHHGFSPLSVGSSLAESNGIPITPYLLYVGLRAPYKNFLLLLDAFSRSGLAGDFELLVIGGGEFSAAEQAKISALGIGKSIRHIPKAGEAALAHAYQNASLFVYPSLYEGFGFPTLEAMSLGCPILVYRTSALPEVCGDAVFYFDSADAGVLSSALVSTLQDAPGIASKRVLGKLQVKLFDWTRSAKSTLDVYLAVLGRD
jgi:glycosyltransferase involved in cell wall biosynthesis